MTKMLFCRIGWMPDYRGERDIQGGGEFVDEHGYGFELYNFLPDDQGNLYGYVRAGRKMSIERLGTRPKADSVSAVLVIWVATHPSGGMRIVGWYRNATVFRSLQPCPGHLIDERPLPENDKWGFNIFAKCGDAVFLPEDHRTFRIPQATERSAGMGNRNIWYADDPKDQQLCQKVLAYIGGYEHK